MPRPARILKWAAAAIEPLLVRQEVLRPDHGPPSGKDSPLWQDDFEGFLKARQALIWAEIQKVTK